MSKWQTVPLGEVVDIRRGASPRPIQDFFAPIGIPWVKIADATINDSPFLYTTKQYIKPEGKNKSVYLSSGNLIVSNSATPGIPKFLAIDACIHDGWLSVTNFRDILPWFLYYIFLYIRPNLCQLGNGSVFTNLKTDILRNYPIPLPPLAEQERIAAILSAFDGKIEANRNICADLEAAAKLIFRRDFIAKPEAEGWEEVKLGDFGQVITGKTPPTSDKTYYGVDIPFITIPDMHNNPFVFKTERNLSHKGSDIQKNKLLPKNTIITSCIATVGLVSLTTLPSQINQQINAIIPKESNTLFYLFNYIKTLKSYLNMIGSSGTTACNVNKGMFENISIPLPPQALLEKFEKTVAPMYAQINNLQKENRSLVQARDLLLPKLMRGEL